MGARYTNNGLLKKISTTEHGKAVMDALVSVAALGHVENLQKDVWGALQSELGLVERQVRRDSRLQELDLVASLLQAHAVYAPEMSDIREEFPNTTADLWPRVQGIAEDLANDGNHHAIP